MDVKFSVTERNEVFDVPDIEVLDMAEEGGGFMRSGFMV